MGQKLAFYSFVAIGMYLAFAYATGTGRVIGSAGDAGVGVIRAFQGR
jgi:hypothetical protein